MSQRKFRGTTAVSIVVAISFALWVGIIVVIMWMVSIVMNTL